MIASIQGEIVGILTDSLVVSVAGVGFQIYTPAALHAQARVGDRVFLHTTLIVRQDALTLYGFEREDERSFFTLLLGVDGVGPRIALATLSALTVETIRRAVLAEQVEVFSRVPGVGKRTAQKMLLHLQGRVGSGDLAGIQAVTALTDVDAEVLDALIGL
ncbi:MAG TPA: Holliday junction branch migration protein RuvA, partial [Anaerolineaceae bacterium]|nr:Holliday junction branch migration protein RuvA [Anaerolineaceae bacterium]